MISNRPGNREDFLKEKATKMGEFWCLHDIMNNKPISAYNAWVDHYLDNLDTDEESNRSYQIFINAYIDEAERRYGSISKAVDESNAGLFPVIAREDPDIKSVNSYARILAVKLQILGKLPGEETTTWVMEEYAGSNPTMGAMMSSQTPGGMAYFVMKDRSMVIWMPKRHLVCPNNQWGFTRANVAEF